MLGVNDQRDLWPEMFRVIRETRPSWVVGENVAALVEMALDRSLSDLEGIGYSVQAFVVPALAVGAPHLRNRVWIVANSEQVGQPAARKCRVAPGKEIDGETSATDPLGCRGDGGRQEWPAEPRVGRVAHGVPDWMDRIGALGNSIVPQIAVELFRAIRAEDETL